MADRRQIETVLSHLLEKVLARLHPWQMGIERLLCKLHLERAEQACLKIGLLHASDSLHYLMELIRLQLDHCSIPGPITARASMRCALCRWSFVSSRCSLTMLMASAGVSSPMLVERLSHRLGRDAILRPRLRKDAQPEHACDYEPWLDQEFSSLPAILKEEQEGGRLVRPVYLTSRPVAVSAMSVVPGGPPLRFVWQGQSFVVARCWGPERIETGWGAARMSAAIITWSRPRPARGFGSSAWLKWNRGFCMELLLKP